MKIPVAALAGGDVLRMSITGRRNRAEREQEENYQYPLGWCCGDNSFGTHEFFELCRQLGCEAYVNGNVGSGTVQEMSEWVEYMTFDGVSPMADLRKENGHEESWGRGFLWCWK